MNTERHSAGPTSPLAPLACRPLDKSVEANQPHPIGSSTGGNAGTKAKHDLEIIIAVA
jgi:hypothetical protein